MTDAPETPEAPQQPQGPQLRVMGQYIKDLSFENPGAPETLRPGAGQPNIDLSIDVQARKLDDTTYEVSLILGAKAGREDKALFVAELVYAGLFQIQGVDDVSREPFLLIECPRILFPFARRILSDATRDGGFPPLMLEPVDFAMLYRRQMAERQASAAEGQGPVGNA